MEKQKLELIKKIIEEDLYRVVTFEKPPVYGDSFTIDDVMFIAVKKDYKIIVA